MKRASRRSGTAMTLLRFEHKSQPLLPVGAFLQRLLRTFSFVFALLLICLGLGVCGYHWLQGLGWLDSLLNASMILSGMGPVDPPKTAAGKWFGSCYALFSGIAFITSAGIGFTPIAHRLLHWFHRETRDRQEEQEDETEDAAEKK
ncbi:MAG TPA: hypothetical protein VFE33_33705 [Thermoanaerobaculia bacterium]|nr:hypothetical protein [Thermoanaerobaculia bacterium]